MEFVAVLTTPEQVFGDHFLPAVGAAQVQNLIIVENDLDVSRDFKELCGGG
jgi:hypothetical protein